MRRSDSTSSAFLTSLNKINADSSEADIEQKIVVPLLQLLGYGHEDWRTQASIGKAKLDFLIMVSATNLAHSPYLVIEVKAPKKIISKSLWQIQNYMRESGATLGLLTNGVSFCLLYHYGGQVEKIAEYSKQELAENFGLFYKLLCKSTCLKFSQAIYNSEQQIHFKFIDAISNVFGNSNMLGLFRKKKAVSTKNSASTDVTEDKGLESLIEDYQERKGMIITVFNNKGGVGKTTTTINLAAALSKLGKRVLLIDVDAQANLSMGVGIDPLTDVEERGLKDITHLLTESKTTLPSTTIRKSWGDFELDIVPSHIRLSHMESTLIQTVDVHRVLARKLKNYKKEYDFIFIDPPPSFGTVNTIALMAASAILIPTQLSPYPIRALEYVISRAQGVEQSRDEPLPILGIAVSMYDKRSTVLQKQMTTKILDVLSKIPGGENIPLFPEDTWIPQLKIVSATPDKGYPLCHAEFDNTLTQAEKESAKEAFDCYTKLAKHLIQTTQDKE